MTKIIFILLLLIFSKPGFSQANGENIIYVIDSILVKEDPDEDDQLSNNDVADITVIKNRDSLTRFGLDKFDGAIFIFTKQYRSRPDSLKQIPSSKQMERKNGVWYLNNNVYTGRFIDYYYSGQKKGEGYLSNGKLNDQRQLYHANGQLAIQRNYANGVVNGQEKEFYSDGSLSQQGKYINGKEEGVWESYYPNGQIKLRSNYKHGEVSDTATKYYSTGRIKEQVFIKNGKVIPDPHLVKVVQLMEKSDASYKNDDIQAAIKYCKKAVELDSTYAQAYFSLATLELNDMQFDQAIADFDKALHFEPYMEIALSNRAFARIRKYQFASSRTLSKNNDVTVLASKDKVPMPDAERELVCSDLKKAVFLGEKSAMITEALADYCK